MVEAQKPAAQQSRPGAMTVAMQAVRRPAPQLRVLRIGVFRDKTVLEERIVRTRESVTVGTSTRNHILIPPHTLPPKFENRFELFQVVGDHYVLNFTATMTGRVVLQSGVQRLEKLRESGASRDAGTHHQIKLSDSSRGNVRIGDFTIFFEFVESPPVMPPPALPAAVQAGLVRTIDWTFTGFVVLAYIAFFAFIIYTENADWAMPPHDAPMSDQLARLVFEEPMPPPEVTDEAPTEDAPAEKPAAEPPRSAQPSRAGEPSEPRPSASSEDRARIAEQASAQAKAMLLGALGAEKGALADVLRGGAVTGNAADVLAQASGVGVATASSGSELRTRSGGDVGERGQGLGSLRKGEGAGAAAAEGVVTERAVRGSIALSAGGDIGGGGEFDASRVRAEIQKRLRAIQLCYERELQNNPSLTGKVTVEFTIQVRGNVTDARTLSNTTGSDAVGECITQTVTRFRFTPGPEGGSVTFRYPFVFARQD